ncbi:MAG TPA: hypothetical protein VF078_13050, partial [Nitrospira sp.]
DVEPSRLQKRQSARWFRHNTLNGDNSSRRFSSLSRATVKTRITRRNRALQCLGSAGWMLADFLHIL